MGTDAPTTVTIPVRRTPYTPSIPHAQGHQGRLQLRTRTGKKKSGRELTQRVPSGAKPPPGTTQWT